MRQLQERSVNWTGVAYPNEGWAEQMFGEPDVERLWEAVAFCTRLDEDDPVAAWREHMARLDSAREVAERAARSTRSATAARAPTSTVGLLERTRWMLGALPHVRRTASNTSRTCRPRRSSPRPTARRAEGIVTLEQPLALLGDVVEGSS